MFNSKAIALLATLLVGVLSYNVEPCIRTCSEDDSGTENDVVFYNYESGDEYCSVTPTDTYTWYCCDVDADEYSIEVLIENDDDDEVCVDNFALTIEDDDGEEVEYYYIMTFCDDNDESESCGYNKQYSQCEYSEWSDLDEYSQVWLDDEVNSTELLLTEYDNDEGEALASCPEESSDYEVNVVEFSTPDGDSTTTVDIEGDFEDPYVFITVQTHNGGQPFVMIVQEIDSDSFTFQLKEFEYQDQYHLDEDAGYLIVENGEGTLGTKSYEVDTVELTTDSWTTVSFSSEFDSDPVVLAQLMDSDIALVTRIQSLGTSSFQAKLQSEEDLEDNTYTATIAWMAIEQGDLDESFLVDVEEDVSSSTSSISWDMDDNDSSVLLLQMETYNGNNPSSARIYTKDTDSATIYIDEETSDDSETWHVDEDVGYVVITYTE